MCNNTVVELENAELTQSVPNHEKKNFFHEYDWKVPRNKKII